MSQNEHHSLREVIVLFLKLGLIAFGGPAAHVALMRVEVVNRRHWLSEQDFLDLLGATTLIPGPGSTQLAIYLGYRRSGWLGLIAAGVCFILPAMVIVLGLAWLYVRYGHTPLGASLLYGIVPVVLAVIVQALWGLARTALRGPWLILLALCGMLLALVGANPLALLLAGAGMVLLARSNRTRAAFAAAPLLPAVPVLGSGHIGLLQLFGEFLKLGAVVFGSGYVLLAYLRADLVSGLHWLTDRQVLDAVAVGQVTPGPVFTTATFIGYVLAGVPGALVATAGIFLPSFLFVPAIDPVVRRARSSAWVRSALDGINVMALALMAAVTAQLARAALVDMLTVAIAVVAAGVLLRWRVNTAWLILAGAIVGLLHAVWTAL